MTFVNRLTPKGVSPALLAALAMLAAPPPPLSSQGSEPQRQLTLQAAVARAIEHHPSALAAEAGVAAAAAAVGEVTATRLPQLGFEASATRYQEPMIVAPLHALDITMAPEFDRTLIRGTASVSYTLFDGGVRGSRVRGARAEASAAESMRESAVSSLIAGVTNTYLQIITARDILAAHDTRLTALESELDRVNKLFAEGAIARVAVLRAEASIAQALAERVATATALEVAERGLARLTATDPGETTADRLVPIQLRQSEVPVNRDALLANAAAANPELQRAHSRYDAAEATRKAAAATWIPNISLFGGYLGFGSGSGDLVTEWQGGAKVTYPIFTGGARTKTNTRAEAMVDVALQEIRTVELSVQDGVDRGLSAVRESRVRVEAVQEAVDHLVEVARIERLALDAGAGTQTEYLRSEADLLRARALLIEARNTEIAARVELARVVGQLSPGWLEHELENTP